jgi:hypothetical protein
MVVQIHAETLPIHTLSILSTTIGCAYLYQCYQISIRPHYMPSFPKTHHYPSTTCPSLTPFSSNHEKLCYLHAWKSSNSSTMQILRFSSDNPICIDTGASCCISNNTEDFVNFLPSQTSSVIHGISSGLTIAGKGTIKWTNLNDDGDEITIHLHNSIYVPEAPMCLLSPQHMAKQTNHPDDGFLSKGKFGILTFSGF